MSGQQIIIGNVYEVVHSRKGTFCAKVNSDDGEWVELEIVSGKAGALCKYNEAEAGEVITARKSFCTFNPQ